MAGETKNFIRLDVETLDQIVLKVDDILLVAETKTDSGIYLPSGAVSNEALKFTIARVGVNVTEYQVGDEVVFFTRGDSVEWKNKIVVKTDKYCMGFVIRR